MGKLIKNGVVYGFGGSSIADEVEYDNSNSDLKSTNIQDAIDEVAGVEMTQEEYDALSEEEKMIGTYWIIDSDEDIDTDDKIVENIINTTEEVLDRSKNGGLVVNEIRGKSEQNSYTGKNLFKIRQNNLGETSGITITIDEINQTLSLTGTATSDYSNNLSDNLQELKTYISKGGTFVFSLVNAVYDGTTCLMRMVYNDGDDGVSKEIIPDGTPVTVPSGSTLKAVRFTISSGTTINLSNVKFQFEEASEATPWEPYVGAKPSPSPDYPQEIKSAVLNTIKTYGNCKNLVESITNGSLTRDYTALFVEADLKPNTTYTLSFKGTEGNLYYINDKFRYDVHNINVQKGVSSITFTTNENLNKDDASQYRKDLGGWLLLKNLVETNSTHIFENVQIEEGPIATEYKPYEGTEVTLSNPIELNGINDVYDIVTPEGIIRRFGKVVFDGSEDEAWIAEVTADGTYRMLNTVSLDNVKSNIDNDTVPNMLCDQFVTIYPNATYLASKMNGITINKVGNFAVYSEAFNTSDVSLWKTYLQSNPITVVYELATPVVEELPKSDIIALNSLKTFDEVTYISSDNGEVKPIIDVDYGCTDVGATSLQNKNDIVVNKLEEVEIDVVNSLDSTDTDKALSANMGRQLKEDVSQNTRKILLSTNTTSNTDTANFDISNYTDYNALYIQMYGDSNVGGLTLYIPKVMYDTPVPFCIDTSKYGSTYTLFALGRVLNGRISIRKSIVTGWSTFEIRVYGLK